MSSNEWFRWLFKERPLGYNNKNAECIICACCILLNIFTERGINAEMDLESIDSMREATTSKEKKKELEHIV